MKTRKILRDCRLKGDGVNPAMLGIARMYNPALVDRQGLHGDPPCGGSASI